MDDDSLPSLLNLVLDAIRQKFGVSRSRRQFSSKMFDPSEEFTECNRQPRIAASWVLTVYSKYGTFSQIAARHEGGIMGFGEKIRELRKAKNLGQRALAEKVGVSFTYISKVENEKLDFGDYPSEELIRKLAEALEHDADELLLLAKKIPEDIKNRVLERPDAFRKIAKLDDAELDKLLRDMDRQEEDK